MLRIVPLIDKVKNRVNDWRNKVLSYAGRLQLIASILSSMQIYWASVFLLPKSVIQAPTTITKSINIASESVKINLNEPVIPEPAISDVPDKGLFTEASYDVEGVITDFNNLTTEVDVSPIPT